MSRGSTNNSADSLFDRIWQRLWPRPAADVTLPHRALWAVFRIIAVFWREFQQNNIPMRSSALTFTIVLSLVPTLALGTAVLKGLGAGDQMRQAAFRFVDQIEGPLEGSSAPAQQEAHGSGVPSADTRPGQEAPPAAPDAEDQQIAGHLHTAVAKIFDYVDRTDFAALGAFGIIGLVFAVLSVLGRIEQAMNVIWQAGQGRPFGRKLMDYLALMILLPLSVNLGFATEAMLQNQKILQRIAVVLPIAWLVAVIFKLLPLIIVVITFSILYRFLPNAKVGMLPALAGGVMGGVSWFLIQAVYVRLQIGVARYNAIYGSFATLPLFLLWLNIAWIVFLAGAEFAFACQMFKDYAWQRPRLTPYNRLALAFDLLDDIFSDFSARNLSTMASLRERHSRHDQDVIAQVLALLTDGGLLRRVEDGDAYVPAAPPAEFTAADVVNIIWGEEGGGHPLANQALAQAAQGLAWPRIPAAARIAAV